MWPAPINPRVFMSPPRIEPMSEPERWLKRWGFRCWGDDSATVETTTVVTVSTTTRSRWGHYAGSCAPYRPDVLPEAGGREEPHPARPLMPIRFQADADFNQIIVSAVTHRYQQIDVRPA